LKLLQLLAAAVCAYVLRGVWLAASVFVNLLLLLLLLLLLCVLLGHRACVRLRTSSNRHEEPGKQRSK
jgi:hypothetical protein